MVPSQVLHLGDYEDGGARKEQGMWDLLSCPETKPRIPALGVQSVSPWSNREVPYL